MSLASRSPLDPAHRQARPAHLGGRAALLLLLALPALLAGGVARSQTVNAVITADNAYGFGYGTLTGLTNVYGGVENCTAADIFSCATGPETYNGIPAPSGTYLYIIAYSDNAVTQGVLGHFTSGTNTIVTGSTNFEVYATGHDINPACGSGGTNFPSLAAINAEIATANAAAGGPGSSVSWVGPTGGGPGTVGALAIGEDNSNVSRIDFPIVCNINGAARWMWYNPQPTIITDPFRTGPTPPDEPAGAGEFLIFRLVAQVVTPTKGGTWGRIKTMYR